MAVVAAFKFHNDFAAGGGARQTNGGHGGFSAGADKAQLLNGRIAGDDALGEVGLRSGGGAKAGRVARGPLNGLDHRRKGMAQDHRSPGAEVVDVAVAIGIE